MNITEIRALADRVISNQERKKTRKGTIRQKEQGIGYTT